MDITLQTKNYYRKVNLSRASSITIESTIDFCTSC